MKAEVGDWLVMKGFTIDQPDQRGLITEVHSAEQVRRPMSCAGSTATMSRRCFPARTAIVVTAAEQHAADERERMRVESVQSGITRRFKSK